MGAHTSKTIETRFAVILKQHDWSQLGDGVVAQIDRVLIDMTYFVHNNPRNIAIEVE
jgi:hypothetical protein